MRMQQFLIITAILLIFSHISQARLLPSTVEKWVQSRQQHQPTTSKSSSPSTVRSRKVPSNSSHLITSLPGLTQPLLQYSGFIQVDEENDGNLFYWFFPHTQPLDKPLIIWLNGGPGCSSTFDGLFTELGPLRVHQDMSVTLNPYSWTNAASVLFIDQPVGTGLSYVVNNSGIARSQSQVNDMFYNFLQTFYLMYPSFAQRPLYLFGESYAGHYIPAFAYTIMSRQNIMSVNLHGCGIGNGWSDPPIQYGSYIPFARAVGIIEAIQEHSLNNLYQQCFTGFRQGEYVLPDCGNIFGDISQNSGQDDSVNVYDVRLYDATGGGDWPYTAPTISAYLSSDIVRVAIHANFSGPLQQNYSECNSTVGSYLSHEDVISVREQIVALLDQYHIRMLFYNGQFDLICNSLGTDQLLNNLTWSMTQQYNQANSGIWTVNNHTAGYTKTSPDGRLTFVRVLGGSHMVPMDKPEETLDMVSRFLNQQSLIDTLQTIPLNYTAPSQPDINNNNGSSSGVPVWVPVVVGIGAGFIGALLTFVVMRRAKSGGSSAYASIDA